MPAIQQQALPERTSSVYAKTTLFALLFTSLLAGWRGASAQSNGHWVTAWGTSPHAPLQFPGLPPAPTYENQTIRMVVRPTIAGDVVRIRLSNVFGTTPLSIGGAHIALLDHGSKIVAQSDHVLTFGGQKTISIPPGSPAESDEVELKVPAFAEVAVSLYLPEHSPVTTMHLLGQHETYVAGPGDLTGSPEITATSSNHTWVWLDRLEVRTKSDAGALVTYGDSITDGYASTPGEYRDWPDQLAVRLAHDGKAAPLSVINEGIGGNRILHDGAGESALARFDRDVLSNPGVTELILLEGINDFGWPHMKMPKGMDPANFKVAKEEVTADEVIVGMKQIVARAHEHGIRVLGATILPYEGADYFNAGGEEKRQAVNRWIRTGGGFDGVVDLDMATRDPQHPARLLDSYQSGDHLHPNNAGYKAMADAIDLHLLRGKMPKQ